MEARAARRDATTSTGQRGEQAAGPKPEPTSTSGVVDDGPERVAGVAADVESTTSRSRACGRSRTWRTSLPPGGTRRCRVRRPGTASATRRVARRDRRKPDADGRQREPAGNQPERARRSDQRPEQRLDERRGERHGEQQHRGERVAEVELVGEERDQRRHAARRRSRPRGGRPTARPSRACRSPPSRLDANGRCACRGPAGCTRRYHRAGRGSRSRARARADSATRCASSRASASPPSPRSSTARRRFPYELVAELGELGLMGIPVPEELRRRRRRHPLVRDRDRGADAGRLVGGDHRRRPHVARHDADLPVRHGGAEAASGCPTSPPGGGSPHSA